MHGVADLSCRDPLAEAHDSPVERVGCDQVLTLIGPSEGLADIGHPRGLGQVIARARRHTVLLEERPNMLGERHRCGEPGRADPAEEDVALVGTHVDDVVTVLGRGAQPGVSGSDVLLEKRRHERAALAEKEGEALLGGRGIAAVGEVLRGRAEHDVSVDRRADEDPLAL